MNLRELEPEYAAIPTHLIDEPELPARLAMDETKLDELVADVKAKGVLVPLSVVRVGDRYEVVAGHRRRLAAGRANLPRIRCLIYPTKDAALEAVKYSENRFREDMTPAEEASYFADLLTRECGNDTNRLAELLGEKRAFVEGRLLLFQGDPEVFNALAEDDITIGVAHELNACTDEQMRRYFLHHAIRDGASISVVTGWVQQWRNSLGPNGASAPPQTPASAPSAVAQTNYFRCYVCGGEHDVHEMQPINVHNYCRKALLDPLLQGNAPPDPRRI